VKRSFALSIIALTAGAVAGSAQTRAPIRFVAPARMAALGTLAVNASMSPATPHMRSLARHWTNAQRSLHTPRIVRGDPNSSSIALTFDDGPHGAITGQLLDLLKRLHVKATFFVVGTMADKWPDLLKRALAEGHELANHTYDHTRLPLLSDAQVEQELRLGAESVERATGFKPRLFRPPGGEYDPRIETIARKLGQTMVLWTVDPGDFVPRGPEVVIQRTLRRVHNGAIILLHDGMPQTLAALPTIVTRLRADGFKFATCTQMLAAGDFVTQGNPPVSRGQLPAGYPRSGRAPRLADRIGMSALHPVPGPTARVRPARLQRQ